MDVKHLNKIKKIINLIFVCLCGVYRSNREIFPHTETSPLPAKGHKF